MGAKLLDVGGVSPRSRRVLTRAECHPFGSGKYHFHQGWNIACPVGTPVYPTQTGVVFFAGHYSGYGQLVAVDPSICILLSENTSKTNGPHLHYKYVFGRTICFKLTLQISMVI